MELAKKEYINEMEQIQDENHTQKAELAKITDDYKEIADRHKEFEKEYVVTMKEKDDAIQALQDRLQ